MIESLPGQLPLFRDDDEAGGPFRLDDEHVSILADVATLPEVAARGLLVLTLVLLFAQDAAESIEAAEPAVEQIAWRDGLLPLRWLRRRAMVL